MPLKSTINDAQKFLDPKDVDCVVYHHPCHDGTGAALSAWLERGEDVQYIKRDYTKPFDLEQFRDKNVIMLDTSLSNAEFQAAKKIAKKLLILDHHFTAQQNLEGEPGCFFGMENSGCVLAWYYFHGFDKPVPRVLQLIEDRDLWRWRERDFSEPLYYAINASFTGDFRKAAEYLDLEHLNKQIEFGKTVMESNKKWCEEMAEQASMKNLIPPDNLDYYLVMCLELDSDKLVSELAEAIYTRYPVDLVMLWRQTEDGKYKISFRNNNPDINVAEIAERFGGGGHKHAAGATISESPWGYLHRFEKQPRLRRLF